VYPTFLKKGGTFGDNHHLNAQRLTHLKPKDLTHRAKGIINCSKFPFFHFGCNEKKKLSLTI
jgi:hypothetical protein